MTVSQKRRKRHFSERARKRIDSLLSVRAKIKDSSKTVI